MTIFLENLNTYLQLIVSIILALMFFVKPIREVVSKWLMSMTNTNQQNEDIIELQKQMAKVAEHVDIQTSTQIMTLKNRLLYVYMKYKDEEVMPELEQRLFIETYEIYHVTFKQNSYITMCYEVIKNKKTC